MKLYAEIEIAEGEAIAAGKSMNPMERRAWLFIGKGAAGVQITFTGADAALAEKIARLIESHRGYDPAP